MESNEQEMKSEVPLEAPAVTEEPKTEPTEEDAKAAALAAIAKLKAKVASAENTATENGNEAAPAAEPVTRVRKKRFGPPANAPREAPKPRKRKSRWETDETSTALIINNGPKWPTDVTLPGGITVVLPAWLTGRKMSDDPAIQAVYDALWDIEGKLRDGKVDMPPERERSPSPPPVYDRFGVRQNTREARYKDKMLDKRADLIEELIKVDKNYMPPSDYRPRRKHRKIFIPVKEFPGYNFIGLIIGPRGNTQKRMQAETNTKIAIRGRGSVKEGAARDPKYDYGEEEELHVLITGDRQEDVDQAAVMIEDLLQPLDETRNEHKRLQLRELAALNGTIKDFEDEQSQLAVVAGDKQMEGVYQLPDQIASAAQAQYTRDIERVHGIKVQTQEDEYQRFVASLGGGPPGPSDRERPGLGMPHRGRHERPGDDLPDDCKLYVAGLSDVFNEHTLRDMFSHFGNVLHAAVIKEPGTGISKGFGFVHFPDTGTARAAADGMNGKVIDNRTLIVKLRSERRDGPRDGPTQYGYDESKIYVAHIPEHATESEVRALFEGVAPVHDVRVITDKMTGQSRGYAFVTMVNKDAAGAAIARLDGHMWGDQALSLRIAGDKGRRPGPGPGPGPPGMPPGGMHRPPFAQGPPPGYMPPPYGGAPPHYGGPGGMHPPPHHAPYQNAPYQPHAYGGPPGPGQQPYGHRPYGGPPPSQPPPVPHGYGTPPPPGYAGPPAGQGYGAGYGDQYNAGAAYTPPAAQGAYGAYGAQAPGQPPLPSQPPPPSQPPLPGQPPLPPAAAPPLPPGQPPLPSEPAAQVVDEYTKFMSEVQQ